ncbi:MAG: OmpH family outer membrane protein [Methylococcales bacterium]|nr:OmpH family outer membrane protein [Methylococcales bacterium]
MKNKIVLFLALMFTLNVSYAELKVGFVNIAEVLKKVPQAEEAKKRLETEFSPRDKQLASQINDIKRLEEKLAKDSSVMNASKKKNLEKEIISKKREAKRAQQEFGEDFSLRRNEELGKLQKRIVEAIKEIAREDDYDLLLTDGVIHAKPEIDVTARVQEKLSKF